MTLLIYISLISVYVCPPFQADLYGQFEWAQRHTKSSWRERYRKHQGRLDLRIAEIVHENPPAPDGKGQYRFRRRGKFEEDEEDFALDAEAEVEEHDKSPTDNDDDPVLAKSAVGKPQKEEEEEDELEEQPDDEFDPRDQDFHREEEEEGEEAARQPSPSPAPPTQRIGRSSQGKPPAPKRRKAVSCPMFLVYPPTKTVRQGCVTGTRGRGPRSERP